MAEVETGPSAAPETVVVRRPLWQRIFKWVSITLGVLGLLAMGIVAGLDTAPGRRVIANFIGDYKTAGGLNIRVGRIEGSIYGKMVLNDVRVSDPQGVFLSSPRIAVDWKPFDYVRNHINVLSAQANLITMTRSPAFKPTPTDPNAPILPDLDIDIGRLTVDRMVLGKAVMGSPHIIKIDGATHIADKRAQITADVDALTGPGIAGGDKLRLRLDAVPDSDRLGIDARITAPARGVVAEMSGLKAPLDFTIAGKGGWKAWTGKASGSLGGAQFADLDLQAHNGFFQIRGKTNPGLYPGGAPKDKATPTNPIARLTAPALDVSIDARLNERKIDTVIALKSDALALNAKGLIDLAQSAFSQFAVDAKLLTPGAILPNLNGRDVTARVVLDGKFATPTVNYVVSAGVLGFGETRVQQLYASGLARVNADHIVIPVAARAARVTGLNAAAGGLLDNVAINGSFAIANGKVLSDNLKIRSRKIDATALIVADLATGMYRAALNGRVNDYRVESFGIVSVKTDAKLVTMPGGFCITAHVAARTSQIFNEGARTFLGGNAAVTADVGYDPNGIITFRNLRLNAPQFRVTRGQGRYDPKGPLAVDADAYSTQYGPLFARVTGTATKPVVLLRAPRPGVGIGLVNLEARVRGTGTSYLILAKGGTNYGPFTADLNVVPAAPLTVDIRNARFAGIDFKGRVQQLASGPFGGRVTFAGSGISGAALLGAQGKFQRVDVAARASNAKIPGLVDFTIGRALVNARAILTPTPQVVADAQVADLRYGPTVISAARAKVNYVGGSGTAQLLATGSNGVPFRLAANARLSPKQWLAALQGQANGIGFRTVNPARIDIDGATYRLQPTKIDFDNGSARVAAVYGTGLSAQLRLDKLDLSVANALVPNLGLGGAATGSLDYAQPRGASVPKIAGQFRIANFTRSSLASVSDPVDVVGQIGLTDAGGEARALVQRGGTTVGRMVATLRPLGAGANWTTRLMAAPLSGGIRYNGPSSVLFSLAGLSRQQLSGPIAIAADFGGRVDAPQLNGVIRADSLTYDNEVYGTRLSQMKIAGRFTNDRLEITQLSARAGEGTVQAQGSVGFAAASGFPIDIRATLNNARLARSDALGATATGTIAVTNSKANGGLIKGDIRIPNARYEIIRQGQAEVPELTGVRRKSDLVKAAGAPAAEAPVGLFKLDIRIRADNQLFVSGMGLESEWEMDMRVAGTSAAPQVLGRLQLVRGTYSFSGKRFEVTKGDIRFNGGPLSDPEINISATTTTSDVDVTINVTGTGQKPQIAFTSTPALPQDEVLSRLLFGSSVTNLSAIQAIQLASALNSLRGSGGGLNPLGKLRSATGIDRLRVLGANDATGQGTSLAAGKYITNNIYVEIITDARGFTATQLEVSLTKALSVLSQAGSFGGSNVTVRYKKDF
ncbi:translocation/assembly module TamB domain-containing protein [Sphingomonas sp. PAMC 26621]|uniref:translocation/assembly module TamB domain-containing protein n=1 Tax=Sphingomonas sp. PAMC 26621 TaxID=1112213 RepID=UPI000287ADC7|nr:translocation/assembly module TamB domain-containing protein [Sphingomonas sp. PAMC 26621]